MQAYAHAVFPGGARIRPQLCLAVAAPAATRPRLADGAAVAIELLHCASLVHDDLPCFDDATTRRGVPSVHAAYGERIAVLAGDALIVLAFQVLAHQCAPPCAAAHAGAAVHLATRVGAPTGIVAGQAWECEPYVSLAAYHRAKTGSLFVACTEAGAMAAGADPARGRASGCAWARPTRWPTTSATWWPTPTLGKPPGQDLALCGPAAPPNWAAGAIAHFDALLASRRHRHPRLCRARPACAPWCGRGRAPGARGHRAQRWRQLAAAMRAPPPEPPCWQRSPIARGAAPGAPAPTCRAGLAAAAAGALAAPGATLLTSRDFQRRAAAPGGCAPVARHGRATCSTWWPASSIRRCWPPACACDLFEHLAAARERHPSWQRRARPAARGTDRLLAAAVALELLEWPRAPRRRYGLGWARRWWPTTGVLGDGASTTPCCTDLADPWPC
jgi:geranylgeranyl diphosphate synthase, type II